MQERAVREVADSGPAQLAGSLPATGKAKPLATTYLRHPRAVSVLRTHTPRGPLEVRNYSSEEVNQF